MIYNICGKEGARGGRVARSYGKGENLLVIENVPVVSYPHCGESYLSAETLHEIERINKLHRHYFAEKRPVEITFLFKDSISQPVFRQVLSIFSDRVCRCQEWVARPPCRHRVLSV